MKNILSCTLACAAALLITATSEAKTYGGFEVGKTFTLRVVKVTSTRQVGYSGTPAAYPVHSAVPKFRKGKVLKFRIKSRGRLTARKISIPFAHASRTQNEYNLFQDGTVAITRNAELFKRKKEPIRGNLNFFVTDTSGMEPVFYTVVYKLKK